MKFLLGRTSKKDRMLAITDVDKALAGKPSSYTRVEIPLLATVVVTKF